MSILQKFHKLAKLKKIKPREALKLAKAQLQLVTLSDLWYFTEVKPLHTRLQLMNFYSTLFPQIDTATTYTIFLHDMSGKKIKTVKGDLGADEIKYLELKDLLEGTGCNEGTVCWIITPSAAVRKEAWKLGIRQFHDRGYISYHSDFGGYSVVHGVSSYVRNGRYPALMTKVYGKPDNEPFVTGVMIDTDGLTKVSLLMVNRSKGVGSGKIRFLDLKTGKKVLEKSFSMNPNGAARIACDKNDIAVMKKKASKGNRIFYFAVDGLATEAGRPCMLREFGKSFAIMHC